MNYKDKRLAGTVRYIREYCEDSEDFEPEIVREDGVCELFLCKLEELDPKAYAYAHAHGCVYVNENYYALAYACDRVYALASTSACDRVYADVRAKLKQLFIESIEEVNCGHN